MRRTLRLAAGLAILAASVSASALNSDQAGRREPIVGGPCEACEAVFEGMPAKLDWRGRIAPSTERGEPLRIRGVVRDRTGQPVAGIIVYAYHTDASGIYPPSTTRHGRLRGWVKTDANGRYQFDTIRPGGYPNSNIPQHVHMHVIEPGRATYYIDEMVFSDDPRLTAEDRKRLVTGRGGEGLVTPTRDPQGVLTVNRDIVLGQNVPGYPVR
jgi:protocatechuate 3,4-dioxygenase beta subunit